ncbi:Oidioi.mRNA.OKI2018_I69.XSR.g14619.t2.cds [Oikopleura dioica]|uniref:protein-tyrosine-phosphatase n=1 Tax=Oikopleura dioica TaxID=34765 RepID=A0ABN7SFD5_OIKDI|nr:Oidioi.mRNA.OKI2018_I69.XSR.g14619.t2.cds [Oikopleura dioica]
MRLTALLSAFFSGTTIHAQSIEFDVAKINREAGAAPLIEPPNDRCTCEWTQWISSDSPKKNDDDTDDEKFESLRRRGYDICEKPKGVQCWDIYTNTEATYGSEVYCSVSEGLFCDFICSDYAIRVACCKCTPKTVGPQFMLQQNGKCVSYKKNSPRQKIHLEDCDPATSYWEWGENSVLKTVGESNSYCLTTQGGLTNQVGQALILDECNGDGAGQQWSPILKVKSTLVQLKSSEAVEGTELYLHYRSRNSEIRLHKSPKASSQYTVIPVPGAVDFSVGAESPNALNLTNFQFQTCEALPTVEFGQWDCTSYNLYSSECLLQCDPGYKSSSQKDSLQICTASGWSGEALDEFECVPMDCPAILPPENGNINCDGKGAKSSCTISCKAGYYLDSGPNSFIDLYKVKCNIGGTWDQSTDNLICRPLFCDALDLDPTVHQQCSGEDGAQHLVGDVCEINCLDENATPQKGYESEVKCIVAPSSPRRAMWSLPEDRLLKCKVLVCEEIVIMPPLEIKASAEDSSEEDRLYPSTSIDFECPKGFELIGASRIVCKLSEDHSKVSWSEPTPQCRRLECKESIEINRGRLQCTTQRYFDSTCTVKCDEGYKPEEDGLISARCQQDLAWSNRFTDCIPKECPPLANPINGVKNACSSAEGSVCSFSCNEGFRLDGAEELTCINEKWDHPVPTCVKVECEAIDQLPFPNGINLCGGHVFNSECRLKCNQDAIMQGPDLVTCEADGNWSAETKCIQLSCDVSHLKDEITDKNCPSNLKVGEACSFHCPEGQKSATTEVRCVNVDNSAQLEVPTCMEIYCNPRCPEGEVCPIPDGHYKCAGSTYGSTCESFCDDGFTLLGNKISTCGEEGWDSDIPTCRQAKCNRRENPKNGQLKCTTRGRLECDYVCDEGYVLAENSVQKIRCRSSGEWKNEPFDSSPATCIPRECQQLSTIQHGNIICTEDNRLNSVCTLVCNSGYHIILSLKESLNSLLLSCKVQEGRLDWVDSDNVVNKNPECTPRTCTAFPDDGKINGGHLECSNEFYFESSCRTVCEEGFTLENENVITCEIRNNDMKWSGVPGKCKQITCENPTLENGVFDCEGDVYGSRCTASCNENYELLGDREIICGVDGVFTATIDALPSCRKITCPLIEAPDNGVIKISSGLQAEVGSTASLSCDDGYQIWKGDKKNLVETVNCLSDGSWDAELTAICNEFPQCRPPNPDIWSCSLILQNQINFCRTVCQTQLQNVQLYRRRPNNDVYELLEIEDLQTRCSKSSWDTEKTDNWVPDDIACIPRCTDLTEVHLDEELRIEISCSHEKGIKYSLHSTCSFKLKENFAEDYSLSQNQTICQVDSEVGAVWSDFSSIIQKREAITPVVPKNDPILGPPEGEDDEPGKANIAAIIVPILLVGFLVGGFLFYKRQKSSDGEKSSKDYPGYSSGLSGGDELQNLLDTNRRPVSTHRDSRMTESLFTDSTVTFEKLEHEYQKRLADDSKLMREEFESINDLPNHNEKCSSAMQDSNKPKNRYNNVIPYDDYRVRLKEKPGDPFSDYINASYIDGKYAREYIAASAPMANTLDDFWRMIWEEKSYIIMMLSNLEEAGPTGAIQVKSERYWPEQIGDTLSTDDYDVFLEREIYLMDFVIRQLVLTDNNSPGKQSRTVYQFHFTSWKDFSTTSEMSLIKFLRKMRIYQRDNVPYGCDVHAPLIVHCSAGCGRAGTFISIDRMTRQLDEAGQMDLPRFVLKMRQQRMKMVQTMEQYSFIYAVLVEKKAVGDTEIEISELHEWVENNKRQMPGGTTGIQHEFDKLNSLKTRQDRIISGNKPLNLAKNRIGTILPFDHNRVPLTTKTDDADYINASFIDGYFHPKTFIATQAPLVDTVEDLWRMMFEQRSVTLITLNDFDSAGLPVFWPDQEREWHEWSIDEGRMVLAKSEMETEIAVIKTMDGAAWEGSEGRISKRMFQLFSYADKNEHEDVLEISQYHISGWTSDQVPENIDEIVYLINSIDSQRRQNDDTSPITVHCSTGAGATGAFIGLYIAIDQMKSEQAVDVLQIVKSLRNQRQRSVQTESQYEFIYNGAKSISQSLDDSTPI